MRALLLAAGLGIRLRPITDTVPKCLVEVSKKPLLEYWLALLKSDVIDEVYINLHYLSNQVESFLSQRNNPFKIVKLYEDHLLGTAGTIKKNYKLFAGEPLMVIHADNLSQFDMLLFVNKFFNRKPNIEITMMTFLTDEPENCGIIEIDSDGVVVKFTEKTKHSKGNLANGAVYILSPKAIDFIFSIDKSIIDFSTEVIPYFIGKINTYHNNIYHRDIGSVKNLNEANIDFKNFS